MNEMLHFLAAPLALTLLLVGIHVYLGLHVLERDVIFVDISLSQVAALGAAFSLFFKAHSDPALSLSFALAFCLIAAAALAWFRHSEAKISQEAIIGITYAMASACLILVLDRLPHGSEHLKSALVGNILFVTWPEVFQTAAVYSIVGILHVLFRHQFWAVSRGERKSLLWDFLFYFLFGIVITFSTQHAGVLVVFSILVVPAALACRFTESLRSRMLWAWAFGVLAVTLAFVATVRFDFPAGAAIVATLTSAFFLLLTSRIIYEKIRA